MIFFDWLASTVSRRSRSPQPFISLYEKDKSGDDERKKPKPTAPSCAVGTQRTGSVVHPHHQPWPGAGHAGQGCYIINGQCSGPRPPHSSPTSRQTGRRTAGRGSSQRPTPTQPKTTYMPPANDCLTPQEFLERISGRYATQVNTSKIDQHRTWIKDDIAPKLQRQGGHGVSVSEVRRLIEFFSDIVFWNMLPTTRFRWVPGLRDDGGPSGQTDDGGCKIEMDPYPDLRRGRSSRADQMLSTLLHECCHAILEQQACRGQCGRGGCRLAWEDQVERNEGHGPAWIKLARGAEEIVNMNKLFDCETGHGNY